MSDTNIKDGAPQNEEQVSEKSEKGAGSGSGSEKAAATKNTKSDSDKISDLESREIAVAQREEAVKLREDNADEKEKELELLQEKLLSDPKDEKLVPGLEFKIDGEKFKFLDDAPKEILFGGKSRTQKDLIKDQNALIQLASNYSLIEKIQ